MTRERERKGMTERERESIKIKRGASKYNREIVREGEREYVSKERKVREYVETKRTQREVEHVKRGKQRAQL